MILGLVAKMVCSLVAEPALRQDLMQEALLYLWRTERDRPGQSLSWYLQGCRFRLQHYLATGRSLDSTKRRHSQVLLSDGTDGVPFSWEDIPAASSDFDETCSRDMISTLASVLRPRERGVLFCLAEGCLTRDIVRRLGLSAPTVTKYRRKIAKLAVKLGIASPKSLGHLHRPKSCAKLKCTRMAEPMAHRIRDRQR